MTARLPPCPDLFRALSQSYRQLEAAIGIYRQLASYFQNSGVEYDDEDLRAFYNAYFTWRGELVSAFTQDLQAADKVFSEAQDLLATGLGPTPSAEIAAAPATSKVYTITGNSEVATFLEDSLSLLNMLENLPEKAGDFASGVREKLESIRLWVQDHDKVTPKMLTSLQNMQRGAERWVKH